MKIVEPCFEILSDLNGLKILQSIERKARTCYKSESKITKESCVKFVKMLVDRGHEAMLEHESVSVRVVCDRAIANEIVRHRLASYAQESTRYVNYGGKDIEFISPKFQNIEAFRLWENTMLHAEKVYHKLIEMKISPQIARSVLPNSLKTEIVITMNLREWRHFFKLRVDNSAHPQMREITKPMLNEFKKRIPIVFEDMKWS